MKRSAIIGSAMLLAAWGIAGCSERPDAMPETEKNGKVAVTMTAGQTPAAKNRTGYEYADGIHRPVWIAGDVVGLFGYDGDDAFAVNEQMKVTAIDSEGVATLQGELTDPTEDGSAFDAVYCAYYPWQEGVGTDPAAIAWTLPDAQYPTAGSFDGDADLLMGTKVAATAPVGQMTQGGLPVPVNFLFTRPLAVTVLGFANIPAELVGEKIETITFRVPGQKISGPTVISLTGDEPSFEMGAEAYDDILLDYRDREIELDEDFRAWILMPPVTAPAFEIVIETEKHDITRTVNTPADNFEFKANHLNTADVNIADNPAVISAKPSIAPTAAVADIFDLHQTSTTIVDRSPMANPIEVSATPPSITYNTATKSYVTNFAASYDEYYKVWYKDNNEFKDAMKASHSMEAYYKIENTSNGVVLGTTWGAGVGFSCNSNKPRYLVYTNSPSNSYKILTATTQMTTTDFYHVVFTYSKEDAKIYGYVNGEAAGSLTAAGDVVPNTNALGQFMGVGCNPAGNTTTIRNNVSYLMNGAFAFGRMYDEPLGQTEVTALYGQITDRLAMTDIEVLAEQLETDLPAKALVGSAAARRVVERAIEWGWKVMNDYSATQADIDDAIAANEEILND